MKILHIGVKDLRIIFRDRAALILMLLAPFAMAMGLGLVTGNLGGASTTSGLSSVDVIVVNLDQATLGNALLEMMKSKNLGELLLVSEMTNVQDARDLVLDDKTAAVVIIPAGFTASIIPQQGQPPAEPQQIEIYQNPARNISASVVQSIVESFVAEVETGRIGGQVAVGQLIASGRIPPDQAAQAGMSIGQKLAGDRQSLQLLKLQSSQSEQEQPLNLMMFFVPSFALLFLMYTVSLGGKTLLTERQEGTLYRLLSTPTSAGTVLVGKMSGTYLIGVAQMTILILAGALLLGLRWGNPPAMAVLILTVVAAATGWGMLLAAIARRPGEVSAWGMAITLLFGLIGGSFFGGGTLPGVFKYLSYITPNYWGQQGFNTLALGGGMPDMLSYYAALLIMAAVLLSISVILFRKRGILQK